MTEVYDRFISLVQYNTASDPDTHTTPSTPSQLEAAAEIVRQLKQIGVCDADVDQYGYVYAGIGANGDKNVPVLGLIAHMDTSPSVSGANIKPRVESNYQGGDILLNKENNLYIKPADYPALKDHIGQDIIVTDGSTLLGADDKAGIAEILCALERLINDPSVKHGKIRIAVTPDEEIGEGADHFDLERFGADFAYTVDGGALGELEYENFNAASADVKINGKNIHTGSAKGKMINALLIGMEFHQMLPVFENPIYTEGYEGFNHLDGMRGDVEKAVMKYIIRDHDIAKFDAKKQRFYDIADFLNKKYGDGTVLVRIDDTYYNMRKIIENGHMYTVDIAKQAMLNNGITPVIQPIRGGTDGARLTYMGLPCPNICTGGHNFHSRQEFISIQSMNKATDIILEIIRLVYTINSGEKQ